MHANAATLGFDAFSSAGLDSSSSWRFSGHLANMKELLKREPGVTAVFAMADVIAIGAIRALYDEGLRVPDDISVIGYDGLKIGGFFLPKLSTITQSVELLAGRSFELMIACVEQEAPARHITVPFTLSCRESVRKIST